MDKLDLLDNFYRAEYDDNNHYLKQIREYDHNYLVSFLERIRSIYIDRNKFGFREDLDLDLLITELEDAVGSAKRLLGTASLDDICYFYYPNANNYNDNGIDLIVVPLIRNTNKILTVFPCSSSIDKNYINYYDFKSNKIDGDKVKTLKYGMSQIEKFNKKYNL